MKTPTKKQKLEWLGYALEDLVRNKWFNTITSVFTCHLMRDISADAEDWYVNVCAQLCGQELRPSMFYFTELGNCDNLDINPRRQLWLEMLRTLVKNNEI